MSIPMIDRQLSISLDALLQRLQRFLRAYVCENRPGEVGVDWIVHPNGEGPDAAILEALKACPELWATAVPPECCIVHRADLHRYAGERSGNLIHNAEVFIAVRAAAVRRDIEAREHHERCGNPR